MRSLIFVTLCLTLLIATGCQEDTPQTVKSPQQSAQHSNNDDKAGAPTTEVSTATLTASQASTETKGSIETVPQEKPGIPEQDIPKPPVFEDFQGAPQLSLFPRVGDFRPEGNSDRLPYWNTFIEHLVKVTGVAEEQTTGSRGWVFRSIKSIDSVGFFSPLGVDPETEYEVSFTLIAELPEGASAGIGILEFNEFLWIGGQYTEETFKQHFRGSSEGKRLTGTTQGKQTFTFTTGPETHMIHVVLFREGAHDRNSLMFDDIKVEEVNK